MTRLQELISISSEPLAPNPEKMPRFLEGWALGAELFAMLAQKNGFYALESALHVLPVTSDPASGLEGWNSESLWRGGVKKFPPRGVFFSRSVFFNPLFFFLPRPPPLLSLLPPHQSF